MDKTQGLKIPHRPGAALPESFSDSTNLAERVRALERYCEDLERVLKLINRHVPMDMPGGGFDLDQVNQTNIRGPVEPQVLYYDAETQKWVNQQLAASEVSYDNSTTGLSATNVQDALDQIYALAAPPGDPGGWQFDDADNSSHALLTCMD